MPTALVVDDTDSIRLLIRTNLEVAGFEVSEAVDGESCLEILRSGGPLPDAITVDVMMPRLDGISTVARIRAEDAWHAIAIVMVTTQTHPADIQMAKSAGVDDYIVKPFDPDALVTAVRNAIDARVQTTP